MCPQDLADMERRCHAAEERHNDLSARLPETTRPLLQQIEAMQGAARAQAEAWASAERAMQERLSDTAARADAAEQRERAAADRAAAAASEAAAARASEAAARSEAAEAAMAVRHEAERGAALGMAAADLRTQISRLEASLSAAQQEAGAAAASARRQLEAERDARSDAQDELAKLRAALAARDDGGGGEGGGAGGSGGGGGGPDEVQPPAMAGPGFKWVLVREGEDEPSPPPPPPPPPPRQGSLRPGAGSGGGGEDGTPPGSPYGGSQRSLAASLDDLLLAPSASHHAFSAPALQAYGSIGAGSAAGSGGPGHGGPQRQHSQQWRGGGAHASAAGIERLRAAFKQKCGETAQLEARVRELEATRDALAEELLAAAHAAEAAGAAAAEGAALRGQVEDLRARYAAAVELAGERDEQLDEVRADLADVKDLFRAQVEHLVAQIEEARRGGGGSGGGDDGGGGGGGEEAAGG
ncbi:MAG: TATA element modulatory factor 1 TATA binding-domain-containing protein [Monoraphidium minutum]|nr:MAG: TATA element modulatory factor 1 TATA binding-domain-containing protein [Monoraphidium minutum]